MDLAVAALASGDKAVVFHDQYVVNMPANKAVDRDKIKTKQIVQQL
jgi:hypothetical protein